MEEQIYQNALEFTQLGSVDSIIGSPYFVDGGENPNHFMDAGSNGSDFTLAPLTEWLHSLQTPLNVNEFLSHSGVSEIENQMSWNGSVEASVLVPADVSIYLGNGKQVPNLKQHHEGEGFNLPCLDNQTFDQKEESSSDDIPIFKTHPVEATRASGFPSRIRSKVSKQKARDADRRRRLIISERVDALQKLLPNSKEGGKASVLNDIIDYIKYLQSQIKELSRSRLGGESTSSPLVFLERYGHYPLHEHVLNEPLEDMMGKLLEINPLAAVQLLQSRGLLLRPTALAESLSSDAEDHH